jgi:hypothetical protein
MVQINWRQCFLFTIVIILAIISINCSPDNGIIPGRIINIANHVVINEVELNPPGSDSGHEWVELYNPTGIDIDISGWIIRSTGGGNTEWINIPGGTIISATGFFCYTHNKQWLDNESEIVILEDSENIEIDRTPSLSDNRDDYNSWTREPNGQDTNSIDDWAFMTSTKCR